MELFFDGGLFELLFVIGFAILVNFIFLKRVLLILFSLLIISAPVILFFIHGNELYNWVVTLCLLNAVLLVVIIWKQKKEKPAEPLFKVENMKRKLSEFGNKISNLFSKNSNAEKDKIKI
jgi:Ca2+/Na+ antiporter